MLSGRLRAAVVLAGARNADANAHIPSVRRRTKGIRIIAAVEEFRESSPDGRALGRFVRRSSSAPCASNKVSRDEIDERRNASAFKTADVN
jgi:hypothetical protein